MVFVATHNLYIRGATVIQLSLLHFTVVWLGIHGTEQLWIPVINHSSGLRNFSKILIKCSPQSQQTCI